MTITYERLPTGEIVSRFPMTDANGAERELMFLASGLRDEKTGLHATITVGLAGEQAVDASNINIEKSPQRNPLANSLAAHLGFATRGTAVEAASIQRGLMQFCVGTPGQGGGLWEYHSSLNAGYDAAGDAEPSRLNWAVPALVINGATGIHFGAAEAGKSTLERLLFQSLNSGSRELFRIHEPEPVVWINAEEPPEEVTRQLGNVNAILKLARTESMRTVDARGMTIEQVRPLARAAVEEVGARHICVDSLSRLARGMSLNDNATATLLTDSLADLGCSVTFIGHTGREDQTHVTGSKHFDNAGRIMTRIQGRISQGGVSPELTRGLRVQVTKVNGAAPFVEPMHFTFEYHRDFGIVEARRAEPEEWPMMNCEAWTGQRECGRRTWDGLTKSGAVRCPQHQQEE